ncbi:MAG: MFS transporter, partial [Bacteroidota bacterium]
PIKFAMGLTILGLGFAILSIGALPIDGPESTVKVSMFWLIAAYLFHTLGELCISPVGLSYVSKLAPVRLVGLMFGVFFVANFVANYFGGLTGSYMKDISESIGLSGFFLLFAAVPISAAIVLVLINGWMKKMMHGIE